MTRVKMAEDRAAGAESIAADLRSQCDAAARTISKLVDENQELVDRLNRQGNALVELEERTAAVLEAGVLPPGGEASSRGLSKQGSEFGSQQQLILQGGIGIGGQSNGYQLNPEDYVTPVAQHAEQRVWNIPGAVAVQGNLPGGSAIESESESVSPTYNTETGGKKKRGGGFWAWVAGADLVETYE